MSEGKSTRTAQSSSRSPPRPDARSVDIHRDQRQRPRHESHPAATHLTSTQARGEPGMRSGVSRPRRTVLKSRAGDEPLGLSELVFPVVRRGVAAARQRQSRGAAPCSASRRGAANTDRRAEHNRDDALPFAVNGPGWEIGRTAADRCGYPLVNEGAAAVRLIPSFEQNSKNKTRVRNRGAG